MWRYGIVEDRLGNPPEGRFALARSIGFDAVELSFGARDHESLPLWTEQGAREVRRKAAETGVALPSVCATYFNQYGLGSRDRAARARSVEVLRRLLDNSAEAGLSTILLPFFGPGAMNEPEEQQWAVESVALCARRATELGLKMGFEATLPAIVLRNIAIRVMELSVGVYYDVGNVRPEGYDVVTDLRTLSDLLVGVHIKDRKTSGENMPLGQGDVDFARVRQGLAAARYRGYLILETPNDGDARATETANLAFLREQLGAA